jgi:DNA-binding MarR family transcriptional regulator
VRKQPAVVSSESDALRDHVDAESQVADRPFDHKLELRLWLRLLAASGLIEAEIRQRLREKFGTTLPRFDLLAQLERVEDGLLLGELSRRMMVSNGNVTGLVERLVQSGLIERSIPEADRRAVRVRLTKKGRQVFSEMADAHAEWIGELLAGLNEAEQNALWSRLGRLKESVLTATRQRTS